MGEAGTRSRSSEEEGRRSIRQSRCWLGHETMGLFFWILLESDSGRRSEATIESGLAIAAVEQHREKLVSDSNTRTSGTHSQFPTNLASRSQTRPLTALTRRSLAWKLLEE